MSDILNVDAAISTSQNQPEVTLTAFRKAMRELAGGVTVVTVGQASAELALHPLRWNLCLRNHPVCW